MMLRTTNPILHRLEKRIETNAPREEIAEALAAAEALGDELPPLLAFRARERIESDRFLGRRRLLFGVACAVFVFLCPFSAIGLTTVTQLRSANRDGATLMQLIDGEQWDEAKAFLDSLDPETRSRQEFVRGGDMVQQELDRREQRKAEFEELVAEIRSDPSALIDETMVSRLDELADSDEQRAVAAEMAAKADEQRLQRETGRVDDQTQQFEKLQKEVDHFFESESESLNDAERTSRTRELQRQLQQFVSANHLSNPQLTEAAKQTAALLNREDRHAQTRSQRQNLIEQVTDSVGDVALFVRSARRFAESFPSDRMSDPLKDLVEDHGVIERANAWIDVLGHPAFRMPDAADSQQSEAWIEKLDHATSLEPDHPLSGPAIQWRGSYVAISNRQQAMQGLRALLQSDLLRPMYVYPGDQQRKYYSDVPPGRDSPTAHVVEYFADLSLSRKTKNFGARYRQQILPNVRLAGHCEYVAKASRVAASMDESEFTPDVYRLINELRGLEIDSQIDPIFKLDLTRRLLNLGITGSEPLGVGFGDWLSQLESSDFPWDANWLSPDEDDSQINETREQAIALLNGVGDWDARVKRMGESFRQFRLPRPQPPVWIGWTAREDERFVALLRSPPQNRTWSGKLFALAGDAATGKTSLVELQTTALSAGQTDVVIEAAAAQVVGAPVYVFPAGAAMQTTDAS